MFATLAENLSAQCQFCRRRHQDKIHQYNNRYDGQYVASVLPPLGSGLITCHAESKNSSQHNQSKKAHRNGYVTTAQHCLLIERLRTSEFCLLNAPFSNRIKKPKTHRYPSLKGTDPKFRRNHKHALHGTMKALVRTIYC